MKKILAIIVTLLLMTGIALADEAVIVVSGIGTAYMEADSASASLGVSLQGSDLSGLQQQVNLTVNAICEALEEAGLPAENIATNYIYINPVYGYEMQTSMSSSASSGTDNPINGYTINNSLSIRTDEIDRLGEYIDAAFAAGANSFDYISFGVKDDSEARKLALELAVQDARKKAEIIAAASGRELGEILEIAEGNAGSNYGSSVRYAVAESGAAGYDIGTTVRASRVEVSAGVQITYELK